MPVILGLDRQEAEGLPQVLGSSGLRFKLQARHDYLTRPSQKQL